MLLEIRNVLDKYHRKYLSSKVTEMSYMKIHESQNLIMCLIMESKIKINFLCRMFKKHITQ